MNVNPYNTMKYTNFPAYRTKKQTQFKPKTNLSSYVAVGDPILSSLKKDNTIPDDYKTILFRAGQYGKTKNCLYLCRCCNPVLVHYRRRFQNFTPLLFGHLKFTPFTSVILRFAHSNNYTFSSTVIFEKVKFTQIFFQKRLSLFGLYGFPQSFPLLFYIASRIFDTQCTGSHDNKLALADDSCFAVDTFAQAKNQSKEYYCYNNQLFRCIYYCNKRKSFRIQVHQSNWGIIGIGQHYNMGIILDL